MELRVFTEMSYHRYGANFIKSIIEKPFQYSIRAKKRLFENVQLTN